MWMLEPGREPATLDQASQLARGYADYKDKVQQLERKEEDMEVGAVHRAPQNHAARDPPRRCSCNEDKWEGRWEKLSTRMAKLEASRSPQAVQKKGTPPQKGKWTEDGARL